MNVYLVMERALFDTLDDTRVLHVYADRAEAQKSCDGYNEDEDMAEHFDYYIDEHEVRQ